MSTFVLVLNISLHHGHIAKYKNFFVDLFCKSKPMSLRQIAEGVRNHLYPPGYLKDIIIQTSTQRLNICVNCPYNTTCGDIHWHSRCQLCGCDLVLKTKCLSCACGAEEHNQKHGTFYPVKWRKVDGVDATLDTTIHALTDHIPDQY